MNKLIDISLFAIILLISFLGVENFWLKIVVTILFLMLAARKVTVDYSLRIRKKLTDVHKIHMPCPNCNRLGICSIVYALQNTIRGLIIVAKGRTFTCRQCKFTKKIDFSRPKPAFALLLVVAAIVVSLLVGMNLVIYLDLRGYVAGLAFFGSIPLFVALFDDLCEIIICWYSLRTKGSNLLMTT